MGDTTHHQATHRATPHAVPTTRDHTAGIGSDPTADARRPAHVTRARSNARAQT